MEDITKQSTLPLTTTAINDLVKAKEEIPTPPKKSNTLTWVFIGLGIAAFLIILGLIIRKWIIVEKQPDIVINAQSSLYPSITTTPSPTGETTTLIPQEILLDSQLYRNETAGFEIGVPSGWKTDDSGTSGAVVVFIDPKTTTASDGSVLLSFINITTGIPTSASLSGQVANAKTGIQKQFENYSFEEDKEILIGGEKYYLIGGTYLSHGTKMRNRNIVILHDFRGYAISATAPESVWPKKELLINASLFSFKNI